MSTVRSLLSGLGANERGATAIEYGLMVVLLAIVIGSAVAGVGSDLSGTVAGVRSDLWNGSTGEVGD